MKNLLFSIFILLISVNLFARTKIYGGTKNQKDLINYDYYMDVNIEFLNSGKTAYLSRKVCSIQNEICYKGDIQIELNKLFLDSDLTKDIAYKVTIPSENIINEKTLIKRIKLLNTKLNPLNNNDMQRYDKTSGAFAGCATLAMFIPGAQPFAIACAISGVILQRKKQIKLSSSPKLTEVRNNKNQLLQEFTSLLYPFDAINPELENELEFPKVNLEALFYLMKSHAKK